MKKEHIIVGLLLLIFLGTSLYSISIKSITNDELTHIPSGYSYLRSFDYRMNPEHPPLIKMLAGFPLLFLTPNFPTEHPTWQEAKQWEFGAQFLYFQGNDTDQLIFWARVPMILIGMLLGLYVFLFAKKLYNVNAAYLALGLYTFSPNILAHTRLVTTDVGLACFSVMTVYYLYSYLNEKNQNDMWRTGLCFGLAMASKFSAIYLIPIIFFIMLDKLIAKYQQSHKKENFISSNTVKQTIKDLFLIYLAGGVVTLLSYGLIHAQAYIQGMVNVIVHSRQGHNAFLWGVHSSEGFTHYFPFAFLIKTPIAMLLLIVLTVIFYKKLNPKLKPALRRDLVLFIPIIMFTGAFITNNINIGLRHILPVYPFLFIWVSQFVNIKWKKNLKYTILGLLLLWYLVASISIAPNYLAYFNELAGGPNNGHKFLIDSNIDWGQDLKQLGFYIKENNISSIKMAYFGKDSRKHRGINYEELKCAPEPGLMAVSVNRLVGFDEKTARCLSWLRDLRPFTNIGHSILLYDVKENDIKIPRENYCINQCKQRCEKEFQMFAEAFYNETCVCRCNQVT